MVSVRIQGISGVDEAKDDISQIAKTYEHALDRFSHTIREVEVWCSDINGPRGGIDKLCRVQLRLHPRGILTAKSAQSSFVHAARDACDKIKALLSKRISKRKSFS